MSENNINPLAPLSHPSFHYYMRSLGWDYQSVNRAELPSHNLSLQTHGYHIARITFDYRGVAIPVFNGLVFSPESLKAVIDAFIESKERVMKHYDGWVDWAINSDSLECNVESKQKKVEISGDYIVLIGKDGTKYKPFIPILARYFHRDNPSQGQLSLKFYVDEYKLMDLGFVLEYEEPKGRSYNHEKANILVVYSSGAFWWKDLDIEDHVGKLSYYLGYNDPFIQRLIEKDVI